MMAPVFPFESASFQRRHPKSVHASSVSVDSGRKTVLDRWFGPRVQKSSTHVRTFKTFQKAGQKLPIHEQFRIALSVLKAGKQRICGPLMHIRLAP